jgi:hypothetical protein
MTTKALIVHTLIQTLVQTSGQFMTRALKTAGIALLGFAVLVVVLVVAVYALLLTVWVNYD